MTSTSMSFLMASGLVASFQSAVLLFKSATSAFMTSGVSIFTSHQYIALLSLSALHCLREIRALSGHQVTKEPISWWFTSENCSSSVPSDEGEMRLKACQEHRLFGC